MQGLNNSRGATGERLDVRLVRGTRNVQDVARLVLHRFREDGCLNHVAALTYTTLFAIVPLVTVTYSILSSFPVFNGVGEQLQEMVFSHFVPSAGETVSTWLTSFSNQARNLTAVGMGFLLITALMMLRTVDGAINTIFHVRTKRRAITSFLLYWAILTLGPLLLGLGLAVSSYLATLQFLDVATAIPGVKGGFLRFLPMIMSIMAFTLLYQAVPNRRVRFAHALTGGICVALLLEIAKFGFSLFLSISPTYQFIYGAFAAVPVFLIWIYLGWLLVLLGAEIVHALGEPRRPGYNEFSPVLSMVAMLSVFRERFSQGSSTMLEDVQEAGWPVGQQRWEEVTDWLSKEGVLGRNSQGALVPARSFSHVVFSELLERSPWPLPGTEELDKLTVFEQGRWFQNMVTELQVLNQVRDKVMAGSVDSLLTDESSEIRGGEGLEAGGPPRKK